MQAVGLSGCFLGVPLGEGVKPLGVGVADRRLAQAQVFDVGLVGVGGGDLAEGARQVGLRAVEQAQIVREMHGGQLLGSTRTAATLNSGCLETGSHAVSVSSFAARGRPGGASK